MRIVGQQSIADLFRVSRETIDTWQQDGFPVAVRGGPGVPSEYDSEACIAWLIDREVKKARNERQQDRLARVQADKIEMDNAARRRVLIPADELGPRLEAAYVFTRQACRDVLLRLVRELPADACLCEDKLQAEFDALLRRLADWPYADKDDE